MNAGAPAEGWNRPGQKSAWRRVKRQLRRTASGFRDAKEIRSDDTYRRLAEGYELPDGSKRIYCYHIRKTAGTSLHLSFMALGGEDPFAVYRRMVEDRLRRTVSGRYGFVAFHRGLLSEGAYFYGRSHQSWVDQPLPPKTFTVTVLRDPIARVHSYFDYLVAGDDADMPGRVRKPERRRAADGFDAFLDRSSPAQLMGQLSMFSDRQDISEAADRIAGCSSVLFTEEFAAGLTTLSQRLDLPLEVRRDRVTGARSTLTEAQVERLRARLEPEYELLARLQTGGIGGLGRVDGSLDHRGSPNAESS